VTALVLSDMILADAGGKYRKGTVAVRKYWLSRDKKALVRKVMALLAENDYARANYKREVARARQDFAQCLAEFTEQQTSVLRGIQSGLIAEAVARAEFQQKVQATLVELLAEWRGKS